MTLTHSIGNTNLPLPRGDNPFEMEYMPFGAAARTISGAYRVQLTGAAWKIRLNFEGLTKAERDSLFSVYASHLAVADTYTMPDGLSFSVMSSLNSWVESQFYAPYSGTVYYDAAFTVEQV
jgi:hypothetical protein